jgi:hypothetical protein
VNTHWFKRQGGASAIWIRSRLLLGGEPSRSPDQHRPPGSPRAWRAFLTGTGLLVLCGLALVAARVVWFDAYWIFREHPPWLSITGGSNRLIDRQTRRAKTLQGLTRRYSVALIGSSTVYHGLDPADVDQAFRGRVFNLGISALLADELPTVARIVASRAGIEYVVVGLDYFMFSRGDVPARLSPALREATGRSNARLGSVISEYALEDSAIGKITGGEDPGAWTYEGFRVTPKLPPELTRFNDAVRRRTAMAYRPETLEAVRLMLRALAGLRVSIYISPVSDAQRRVLADAGLSDDFERWRADILRTAAANGLAAMDLADLGSAFPFAPDEGSTDAWLDNLHFTPVLGRMVLEKVGLRSAGAPATASPR